MIAQGIAAVGDVLAGKYRVDQVLGIGGMGMVVAATHLELEQRVALKFMLPGAHSSPDSAMRFLREARAAGRLNSEHVCRVMDVGRFASGAPYIVMEYLHGESLATHLRRRGALPVAEAVDLVLQAIEGIAEAHAHGIIHRDLKPDNLFLARRNDGGTTVKVLDFGISKLSLTGGVTSTGDIMGSPSYMAPEQMQSSKDVDARADIWSIGVVLYQLVVGKLPFDGDTLPMLCMHVVNDEPPAMSESRRDLQAGFEAAVMVCLRKAAEDRYADVSALAQALVPYGSAGATGSAARISVVLRRAVDPKASHEFSPVASTVDGVDRTAPTQTARPEPGHTPLALQGTTLGHTSGQAIERASIGASAARAPGQRLTTRQSLRQRWGLAGAVAVIGVVGLLVVIVWRSGPVGEPAGSSVPAARPALIVEPIEPSPPADAAMAVEAVRSPDVAAGSAAPATATPASDATAAAPAAAVTTPSAAPIERKKRLPPRAGSAAAVTAPAGVKPTRARRGEPADPYAGSAAGSAGSAAPANDDDKWTHMTHDQARP